MDLKSKIDGLLAELGRLQSQIHKLGESGQQLSLVQQASYYQTHIVKYHNLQTLFRIRRAELARLLLLQEETISSSTSKIRKTRKQKLSKGISSKKKKTSSKREIKKEEIVSASTSNEQSMDWTTLLPSFPTFMYESVSSSSSSLSSLMTTPPEHEVVVPDSSSKLNNLSSSDEKDEEDMIQSSDSELEESKKGHRRGRKATSKKKERNTKSAGTYGKLTKPIKIPIIPASSSSVVWETPSSHPDTLSETSSEKISESLTCSTEQAEGGNSVPMPKSYPTLEVLPTLLPISENLQFPSVFESGKNKTNTPQSLPTLLEEFSATQKRVESYMTGGRHGNYERIRTLLQDCLHLFQETSAEHELSCRIQEINKELDVIA
jgi:hypothetical protein